MKVQRKTTKGKLTNRKSGNHKAGNRKPKVDPITLSVVRGVLETTQREMTLALEKTARSSVFNLAHDYTTARFVEVTMAQALKGRHDRNKLIDKIRDSF